MPISRHDVGCWVVRGVATSDAVEQPAGKSAAESCTVRAEPYPQDWCLARTYRNGLVEPGDLIVRYLGGQKAPAIVELGRVTRLVEPAVVADKPVVRYHALTLREPIPRQVLKDDPVLSGCELIRVARAANPLHLTQAETLALAAYLEPGDLEGAGWNDRLTALQLAVSSSPT